MVRKEPQGNRRKKKEKKFTAFGEALRKALPAAEVELPRPKQKQYPRPERIETRPWWPAFLAWRADRERKIRENEAERERRRTETLFERARRMRFESSRAESGRAQAVRA